jgi:LDH2 family malate/lactate/ureidoglycolate dehydrogenase
MVRVIRASDKMEGWDRIYIHGEDQWEAERDRQVNGIPLDLPTYESLEQIATELNIPLAVKK